MNKSEIIEKNWPKPSKCDVSNISLMTSAIAKMMDEWVDINSKGQIHQDWVVIKKDPFGEIFQHFSGTIFITGTWNGKGMEYSIKQL